MMRRSSDGGRTWDEPCLIVDHRSFGEGNANNFVIMSDRATGRVHALFCHRYARYFYMTSDDDGATFSEPVEITPVFEPLRQRYAWRVVAAGPGHGIQLRDGRMLVPVWISTGEGKESGEGKLGHRPSAVTSVFSDDGGKTWQCGQIVVDTEGEINSPSETVAVELSDGRVLFNVRSESPRHRRLISTSADGATGWSKPVFDDALVEPVCMGSIERVTWPDGEEPGVVVFANPANEGPAPKSTHWRDGRTGVAQRQNLTVRASYDDCQTWPVAKALEPGWSGYSDLAVAPDGTLLCFYECGRVDGRMCDDQSLTLARFDLNWLTSFG
jgi:sialidase-1